MIDNSSKCGVLPCNFSDLKLTLEMTTSAMLSTLVKDLVDLFDSVSKKICIDQLGGYIPPVIIFGEG